MAARTSPAPRAHELLITRAFDAPQAVVFAAWASAEQVAQWWGPGGYTVTDIAWDFRVGGAWRITVRNAEGTEHKMRGAFREIDPPRRIVFTYDWENPGDSEVTVELAERNGRTRLTFHQGPIPTSEWPDAFKQGWGEVLEKLARHVGELGRSQ